LPVVDVANVETKKITVANMFHFPHTVISDSTTQTIANAANAQLITFDTNGHLEGMTHSTTVNPSRVYVEHGGHYMLFISAIADLSGGTNQQLDIWLRINENDVPNSNTIVIIGGTSKQTLAVMLDADLVAGDYVEFVMAGTNTSVRIEATGTQTNPTRPACPSVILSAFKVSS